MLFVIIIAAAVAVLLALFAGLFSFAFLRRSLAGVDNLDSPQNAFLQKYRSVIEPGMQFIQTFPYEEISVCSFDGLRLAARFYPREGSERTVILFHGYRSSGCRDFSCAVKIYWEMGLNVLLVDQRAHGKSQGRIICFGVKERYDVLTWVEYVLGRFGANADIFLGGMSMGASTVLFSAGLDLPKNVKGIVADCGYSSPAEILSSVSERLLHVRGRILLPVMNLFCRLFGRFDLYKVSTRDALARCDIPVLFIHGKADDFVPPAMSEASFAAARGEKRIFLVEGAGHGFSFLLDTEGVTRELKSFIHNH